VIDIATTPEAFYVRLDMAGVAREDIKASVQDNALVVRGDKGSSARDGVRVIRSERVFGDFTRTIPLPSDADENDIAASLSRGVLELRIGRRSARGAREIEIRAGE
jgi:HSP20 family protein